MTGESRWEDLISWCNKWGNAASVLSLFITVAGFALTLWRLWTLGEETRKIERSARQNILRLGAQLLAFETSHVNHLMEEFLAACRDRHWPKALEKCHQLRVSITRLVGHPQLEEAERVQFRSAFDDFGIVTRYIEKYRIGKDGADKDLPPLKKKMLDAMTSNFLQIESRLRHSHLETDHVG